jgi:hypothetical protein
VRGASGLRMPEETLSITMYFADTIFGKKSTRNSCGRGEEKNPDHINKVG